jgi:succinate dehydrogenase / fumarate reductase cytochrome b subunit
MTEPIKKRPEFRNIHAFKDLPTYRLPAAGIVSILHRISGVIMFALLPFILWIFELSVQSEISFDKFKSIFNIGIGWIPGIIIKIMILVLVWAYLHHFIAGLRHLWMDTIHSATSKDFGKKSAAFTLTISMTLVLILGAKIFGFY